MSEDSEQESCENIKSSFGLTFGIVWGVCFGVVFNNIAVFMPSGIALGIVYDRYVDKKNRDIK